ncbi:50S ribosomal protein L11 [Candidatus Shikimatogenerans bostrichidophilus]|uniref:50S ribosomal protein L11 n=1 Tax=Candidatus Shikimatogenerans bostrichidophilus TaxID=2943807 RepID=UPI002967309F
MNNNNILKIIKLSIPGGKANPSPPIGPSLGSVGINIMDFCNNFNKKTEKYKGKILPIIITVYNNKTYDFIIKKQTIKEKIFSILNIKKGSSEPKKKIINNINIKEVEKLAKYKLPDLNCFKLSSAISMIIGTLKSMGINVIKNEK